MIRLGLGVFVLAVALLVVPVGPVRTSSGPWDALRGGVADVPRVVATALRLAARLVKAGA